MRVAWNPHTWSPGVLDFVLLLGATRPHNMQGVGLEVHTWLQQTLIEKGIPLVETLWTLQHVQGHTVPCPQILQAMGARGQHPRAPARAQRALPSCFLGCVHGRPSLALGISFQFEESFVIMSLSVEKEVLRGFICPGSPIQITNFEAVT